MVTFYLKQERNTRAHVTEAYQNRHLAPLDKALRIGSKSPFQLKVAHLDFDRPSFLTAILTIDLTIILIIVHNNHGYIIWQRNKKDQIEIGILPAYYLGRGISVKEMLEGGLIVTYE